MVCQTYQSKESSVHSTKFASMTKVSIAHELGGRVTRTLGCNRVMEFCRIPR